MPDLSWRERIVLVPLVVMVFWFGMYVTDLDPLPSGAHLGAGRGWGLRP